MLVLIHLHDGVEALFQSIPVSCEAYHRKDDLRGIIVGTNAKELGNVAGIDIVATGGASVAGKDSEIRAC